MTHESHYSHALPTMNPSEVEPLTRFLKQLRDARVTGRDPDADRMISETVQANPDAAYLLVQRAMLVEQALNNAKAQIALLQQRLKHDQIDAQRSGFLSGHDPWAATTAQPADRHRIPGGSDYPIPRAVPASAAAGSGSSFLGNLASTAAGVVAGSFLFQGIGSLLGHHGATSGFDDRSEPVAGDTTINNYFGDGGEQGTETWAEQDGADPFLASDDTDMTGDDGFLDGFDDSSWV